MLGNKVVVVYVFAATFRVAMVGPEFVIKVDPSLPAIWQIPAANIIEYEMFGYSAAHVFHYEGGTSGIDYLGCVI